MAFPMMTQTIFKNGKQPRLYPSPAGRTAPLARLEVNHYPLSVQSFNKVTLGQCRLSSYKQCQTMCAVKKFHQPVQVTTRCCKPGAFGVTLCKDTAPASQTCTSNANGWAAPVAPASSRQCSKEADLICWGRTTVVLNLDLMDAGVATQPAQVCGLLLPLQASLCSGMRTPMVTWWLCLHKHA
jgi:hypothetical protein